MFKAFNHASSVAHCATYVKYYDDKYIEDLLNLGGSSAGARPKVLMALQYKHWLTKFPSNTDPKDIGAIEYAYHLMAQDAGVSHTSTKLIGSAIVKIQLNNSP